MLKWQFVLLFVNFCFGRWLLFVFYRCKRQNPTKVRIGFAKSVNP